MNEMISAVLSAVGAALGGVLFAFVMGLYGKYKALGEGIQSLLRSDIVKQNDYYVSRGCCPVWAKDSLQREYKAYHNLGGNDIATHLYEEVINLPQEEVKKNGK